MCFICDNCLSYRARQRPAPILLTRHIMLTGFMAAFTLENPVYFSKIVRFGGGTTLFFGLYGGYLEKQ